MDEAIVRFTRRFAGFERAFGQYVVVGDPAPGTKATGKARTVRASLTEAAWREHLTGKTGLGVIPVREDGTCVFAAIDVDRYDADHVAEEARVRAFGIPLVVCRTKSGGLHLYLFTNEPVQAKSLRKYLKKWSTILGHGGSEIFPKQDRIQEPDGVGSWINLPYFDGDRTLRYAIADGKALTLSGFLDHADAVAVSADALKTWKPIERDAGVEYDDAPPCIRHLVGAGLVEGNRNEALFAIGVYLKKKHGEAWEGMLGAFNRDRVQPSLSLVELGNLAKSLERKDYAYPCSRAFLAAACDKDVCAQGEYGVARPGRDPGITFEGLIKVETDPPTWLVTINGSRVSMFTEDLLCQRRFHTVLVESANILPRTMRNDAWNELMRSWLETVVTIEAPPDAGRSGQVLSAINYFVTERPRARNIEEVMIGKCWADGGRVYFRSADLMKYLDTGRFRGVTARDVWNMLRKQGASTKQVRIKKQVVRLWGVEVAENEVPPSPPSWEEGPDF